MATKKMVFLGLNEDGHCLFPLNRVACASTLNEVSVAAQDVKTLAPNN
jgi:hypothetical protein